MKEMNNLKYLKYFLWLVAFHSFAVGAGLIFMPGFMMEFLGFGICPERFFRTQGGVFHIAMAVGYAMAAYNPERFRCLVIFSIVVKFMATIFLFTYFVFVSSIFLILLSMVSDLVMGIIILYLFKKSESEKEGNRYDRK
ncbi:MAG: hypothetical protein AB9882_04080 [Ignavibacteriaceae bacterium]